MTKCLTMKGTLMRRDIPLCSFSIYDGYVSDFLIIADAQILPFELQHGGAWGLKYFLCDRVVPTSRVNLEKRVKEAGFHKFDISELTVAQNASACDDTYWVRFDDEGPQTWEELQTKIGYTKAR